MKADIGVDYHGSGHIQSAFHPFAKVTSIFGRIELPEINLTYNDIYNYDFTLPEIILNPFMQVVGLQGVDYAFIPLNPSAGQWRLSMSGQVSRYKQKAYPYEQYTLNYSNPATRQSFNSYIIYGGFRG